MKSEAFLIDACPSEKRLETNVGDDGVPLEGKLIHHRLRRQSRMLALKGIRAFYEGTVPSYRK